jgi:hypothetical protein
MFPPNNQLLEKKQNRKYSTDMSVEIIHPIATHFQHPFRHISIGSSVHLPFLEYFFE